MTDRDRWWPARFTAMSGSRAVPRAPLPSLRFWSLGCFRHQLLVTQL